MSNNKQVIIGGTYNWRIQVGVPEDKVDELREKFGEGTYHNGQLHNFDDGSENKDSVDYMVRELGGTTYSENYGWDVDVEEFDVEEDE